VKDHSAKEQADNNTRKKRYPAGSKGGFFTQRTGWKVCDADQEVSIKEEAYLGGVSPEHLN